MESRFAWHGLHGMELDFDSALIQLVDLLGCPPQEFTTLSFSPASGPVLASQEPRSVTGLKLIGEEAPTNLGYHSFGLERSEFSMNFLRCFLFTGCFLFHSDVAHLKPQL